MTDNEATRQRIVASVFSKRNAAGGVEENYRGHIKIWEQGEGGDKPRYILLSGTRSKPITVRHMRTSLQRLATEPVSFTSPS
jgi:hypothetical protein